MKEPWISKKVQESFSCSCNLSNGIVACCALLQGLQRYYRVRCSAMRCLRGTHTVLDVACSVNVLYPFAPARVNGNLTILGRHL